MAGWVYRKLIVRLLELDDTPREIARGIAIGVFVAMTPTVGIQMLSIAFLCTLFRSNRIAGVAMAWISNPLTIVPIYWLDYVIGSMILRTPMIGKGEIAKLLYLESTGLFGMFFEFLGNLGSFTFDLAGPMFLGGAILGVVCAIPSYYIFLPLFTKWKKALKKEKEATAVSPPLAGQVEITTGEKRNGADSQA